MTSPSPTPAPAAQPDPILVSLGDIHISKHWLVTPNGNRPLKGTELTIGDFSYDTQAIPVWAIVLAVVFFPLGLLFLLAKEPRASGYFQAVASNDGFTHQAAIAATGPSRQAQFIDLQNRANYARSLIAQAL